MRISVTTNSADNEDKERGRKLGLEEFELGMRDDATPEQATCQCRQRCSHGLRAPAQSPIVERLTRHVAPRTR